MAIATSSSASVKPRLRMAPSLFDLRRDRGVHFGPDGGISRRRAAVLALSGAFP
jgi:hypothetical protein